jgi:hypothetical protein
MNNTGVLLTSRLKLDLGNLSKECDWLFIFQTHDLAAVLLLGAVMWLTRLQTGVIDMRIIGLSIARTGRYTEQAISSNQQEQSNSGCKCPP